MICDRCGQPLAIGEHGQYLCPLEPRRCGYAVIGDDIPGGFRQEHFGDQVETFYSKKAMARRAKELGLVEFVRHTDDARHPVERWV